MKSLQEQSKAIMRALNRFLDPGTYIVKDGELVRPAPKEEPRPQYALDNERAQALSRSAAEGEAERLRTQTQSPAPRTDEDHDGD